VNLCGCQVLSQVNPAAAWHAAVSALRLQSKIKKSPRDVFEPLAESELKGTETYA